MPSLLLLAQESATGGFFSDFDADQRFVIVLVGISCLTVLTIIFAGILGGVWHSIRDRQIEADLKRDMLDRGMSAEEVEQVIEAAPKSGIDRWMSTWAKSKRTN